jgi:hypothetical protein
VHFSISQIYGYLYSTGIEVPHHSDQISEAHLRLVHNGT